MDTVLMLFLKFYSQNETLAFNWNIGQTDSQLQKKHPSHKIHLLQESLAYNLKYEQNHLISWMMATQKIRLFIEERKKRDRERDHGLNSRKCVLNDGELAIRNRSSGFKPANNSAVILCTIYIQINWNFRNGKFPWYTNQPYGPLPFRKHTAAYSLAKLFTIPILHSSRLKC